ILVSHFSLNITSTLELHSLSLHDALPISINWHPILLGPMFKATGSAPMATVPLKAEYMLHDFKRTANLFNIPYKQPSDFPIGTRSEEHTSELQSRFDLVCRLLLENNTLSH